MTESIHTTKDDSHDDRLPATLGHILATRSMLNCDDDDDDDDDGTDNPVNGLVDTENAGVVALVDSVQLLGVTGVVVTTGDDEPDAFSCCTSSISWLTCSRSLRFSSSRSFMLFVLLVVGGEDMSWIDELRLIT